MSAETARPSLLYLVTEDWYFWKHRGHLARAARDAGFRVMVAAAPGKFVKNIEDEGFEYYPLSLERKSVNPLGQARVLLRLTILYRSLRPDIVHHVAVKPILYGAVAARLAGIKRRVNALTGLGYVFTANGLKRRLLRAFVSAWYRLALGGQGARNVFQNPDDMGLFISSGLTGQDHSVLIRGAGVDIERFSPSEEPSGPPKIVLAARMLRDKGVLELFKAAEILAARGLDFKVVLAGLPDEHNPTAIPEATLRSWNDRGYVDWSGHVEDMAGLLGDSHIACLPSHREGLPLFLLEAAASGRPIIATDVPGCREIVLHEKTGLLVPPRDPEALANALERLMRDADLRKRMGRAGRELAVSEFSERAVQEKTIALYKELIRAGN